MAAPVSTRRPDGRCEGRIPKRLAAELSRPDESVPKEMTFTENVSPRGVRVSTVRRWQPGTRVEGSFTASARKVATSPLGWSYRGRYSAGRCCGKRRRMLGLAQPMRNIDPENEYSVRVHPIPFVIVR